MILSATFRKMFAVAATLAVVGLFSAPILTSADCYGNDCGYTNYNNYDNNGYRYSNDHNYDNNYYPYSNQYPIRYNYPPSCTITIQPSPYNYAANQYGNDYPMLLTWSSSNATQGSISPNIGAVSPNGSRIVYTRGQIYSMSVYGVNGGTATCQTSSYYVPNYDNYSYNYNYPYSSSYVYPATYNNYPTAYTYPTTYPSYSYSNYTMPNSYVALTQIPYTGVSFGLWGDALVWLSLTLVAVFAAASLIVLKRRELLRALSYLRSSR